MSKDSHFTGQPVYSQVLKLLNKEKILILKFYQTVILLRLLLLHWLSDEHIIFLLFFLPGSNKKPCFCWQISFTKHTNLSGKH